MRHLSEQFGSLELFSSKSGAMLSSHALLAFFFFSVSPVALNSSEVRSAFLLSMQPLSSSLLFELIRFSIKLIQ